MEDVLNQLRVIAEGQQALQDAFTALGGRVQALESVQTSSSISTPDDHDDMQPVTDMTSAQLRDFVIQLARKTAQDTPLPLRPTTPAPAAPAGSLSSLRADCTENPSSDSTRQDRCARWTGGFTVIFLCYTRRLCQGTFACGF